MGEFRLAKLGEQIRGEIALLISTQKIKDPRVSTFLTINRVEVAADLAYAKVYVSSFFARRTDFERSCRAQQCGRIHSIVNRKKTYNSKISKTQLYC
jgi:ribosome-binding factor A